MIFNYSFWAQYLKVPVEMKSMQFVYFIVRVRVWFIKEFLTHIRIHLNILRKKKTKNKNLCLVGFR